MAGAGVELATAWVRLVPSIEGVQGSIAEALLPAQDEADEAGKKSGGRFGKGLAAGLAGAGIVALTVGAFKGLYEIGSVFDDITDTIRVGTGAQGDALGGLVDVAKNVGLQVPAEFEAIGSTVSDLNTRLGLSGATLETVASQYLEAGRILGDEVDINATSAAFSAFKIEGDAVVGAMDTLFQVSQATGVGMNELATGAQAMAPAMQTLGFSFEDTVAMVGSFDKAGLNSTAIMASMSKGMVTLAKEGEQPADAYARVVGELQSFVDAGDKASALDLASQVFGTRGAAQFVGALESGVLNMDDLMAATGATGDTILGVGEETMDFAERWQLTMNQAMVAIEPLASAVFTALGDGLAGAMPFLQELGAWVGENTEVIGIMAAVIGGTLVAAFIAWTASIWASTVALLANPVTWIILGIVALGAAVVALVMNWDAVVAWITEVWSGFVVWITEVTNGFVAWWNGMWAGFAGWITGVWNGFIGWIVGLWQGFIGALVNGGAQIAGWWNGLWAGIGAFIVGVWNGFVAGVQGVWNGFWGWIVGAIGGFGSWLSATWSGIWNGLAGVVRGVWNSVIGFIQSGINGAIGLINGMINGVNAIGGAIGIELSTIPTVSLPRLADGATVLPRRGGTAAILAEAGRPETVVDTGLMNRALEEGLEPRNGAGSGETYVLNGLTTRETAAQLAYEIDKTKRRKVARAGGLRLAEVR
ncbi:hypothetical protein ACFVR6_03640 [Microbacterium sp. NPDC058021]|uniref:hypothetical protein n=1 Tax=Microbacterium sp. NPDC058021 TaxID=3346306 RepID=UPI0036D99A92